MAWFQGFRNNHGFTYYGDNRTAVTCDIPLVIVMYLSVLVFAVTLLATLGIRGREKWSCTIRASYAVAIGSIILVCLVGYGWQEGSVKIKTPYIYRNNRPFEGYVGIKVALLGANVTLDGYYDGVSGRGYEYYSESIPWPDFGSESAGYDYFLVKGLPEPILKVMGFMTVDEGGLRWGRSFHSSGHFSMVLLSTSLAFWITSNVLLCSVVVYGAYLFMLTGLTMVLACISYHVCQSPLPLVIRFNDDYLRMSYGWSYWLTLVAGSLTLVLGLVLIIADHCFHDTVSEFFYLEKLSDESTSELKSDISHLTYGHRAQTTTSPDKCASIFLEKNRQPRAGRSNLKSRFLPEQPVFFTKSLDGYARFCNVNPVYSKEDQVNDFSTDVHKDHVKFQLECVYEEAELSTSDTEVTQSTHIQDREKHVNEGMPTSAFGILDGQEVTNGRHKEDIFSIDLTQTELSEVCSSTQVNTRKNNPHASRDKNSLSEVVCGCLISEDLDRGRSCEILLTVEPSYNTNHHHLNP